MIDPAATVSRPTSRPKIILLQLIFAYILGLRLWFDLAVVPMGDEAYYWMWGQHLSWSYFDHPPLHAWLLAVVAAIFGWSNFSVRLLTWLSLAGTLWIFWLWGKRLAPNDRTGWFWHTAVIYLTIPVVSMISTFAFHDHLLLFLSAAATYLFWTFAKGFEAQRPDWRRLYGAAALLGLAALTKYTAVLLGLSFAVWIVARPPLRPLLLRGPLWLALLLVALLQTPVIGWNLAEGFASFRFHLAERPSVDWAHPRFSQVSTFVFTLIAVMSPALFISTFRLFRHKPTSADESRALGLSTTIFLVWTAAWAVIAPYIVVFFHWNIVAYASLAPVAFRLLGRSLLLWLHIAFGLVVVTIALVSYTVTPIKTLGFEDKGAAASYGWPNVADAVRTSLADHPDAFPAATRYTYAAQLGFMLHDANVAAFNPLRSENDYWWDKTAHLGKDAIIVADRAFPIDNAKGVFESVERLKRVRVVRLGQKIWEFDIWLGHNYTGEQSAAPAPEAEPQQP